MPAGLHSHLLAPRKQDWEARRTLRSHGKIGDCEQSIQNFIYNLCGCQFINKCTLLGYSDYLRQTEIVERRSRKRHS